MVTKTELGGAFIFSDELIKEIIRIMSGPSDALDGIEPEGWIGNMSKRLRRYDSID